MEQTHDRPAIPEPLPASSRALRDGRVEAGLVETYHRFGARRSRREFEVGRFRTLREARLWATSRLVELDAGGQHEELAVVFTGYAEARGWRSQDLGRLSIDEARALLSATPDDERKHR